MQKIHQVAVDHPSGKYRFISQSLQNLKNKIATLKSRRLDGDKRLSRRLSRRIGKEK